MSPTSSPQAKSTKPNKDPGLLGVIEKIGNILPNPFWLFVVLSLVVIAISWLGSLAGMQAVNPGDGSIIKIENLASGPFVQKMLSEAVPNFVEFAPVGLVLVCMMGVAIAEYSGLIGTAIRLTVAKVSPRWLTFVLALTGVTGSIASDAIFVILIPLGAAAFRHAGRSPIVGAIVAFAASAAGFNSSLLLNITDVLLAGISTQAAQMVDKSYVVSPLANYYFSMASAIILSLIITALTELFMAKKVRQLIDHDEVDHEAAEFISANSNGEEAKGEDEGNLNSESDEDSALELSPKESKALVVTSIVAVIFLAAWFAALFVPGSMFRGTGGVLESPLLTNIVVSIALFFAVVGIAFGLVAGSITSLEDVPNFMKKGLDTLTGMMVLFFAVSQFTAYFKWSNLGPWLAVKGSEVLSSWNLPPLVLFAALVLLVAVLNLMITSGSAQWALMAPVIVPMMMHINVSPEIAQMLFRIGDSPTNIITPMSPYFALALTYLQKYYKKAGVGTLMSLTIPYSMSMLVGWFLFFVVWYLFGLPLGPGVPIR